MKDYKRLSHTHILHHHHYHDSSCSRLLLLLGDLSIEKWMKVEMEMKRVYSRTVFSSCIQSDISSYFLSGYDDDHEGNGIPVISVIIIIKLWSRRWWCVLLVEKPALKHLQVFLFLSFAFLFKKKQCRTIMICSFYFYFCRRFCFFSTTSTCDLNDGMTRKRKPLSLIQVSLLTDDGSKLCWWDGCLSHDMKQDNYYQEWLLEWHSRWAWESESLIIFFLSLSSLIW